MAGGAKPGLEQDERHVRNAVPMRALEKKTQPGKTISPERWRYFI